MVPKISRRGAVLVSTAFFAMAASAAAQPEHFHPKGKPPSKHTIAVLEQARKALPFGDARDFEEQKKGFIAAPKFKKIMADAGHVAWDMERYQWLVEGENFASISLEDSTMTMGIRTDSEKTCHRTMPTIT